MLAMVKVSEILLGIPINNLTVLSSTHCSAPAQNGHIINRNTQYDKHIFTKYLEFSFVLYGFPLFFTAFNILTRQLMPALSEYL